MNACFNKISEQLRNLSPEDLTTVKGLQNEFATELATLRGRVDILEARTVKLEANQFSTTKLSGLVALAVTSGGFSSDRIVDATGAEIADKNPNATVLYRVSLNFDTSFSGTDLLKVRLEAGSDRADDNAAGFLERSFGSVIDFSFRSPPDDMWSISQLSYTFTPFKNFAVTLAPSFDIAAFVDRNLYANASAINFSTNALTNNYILFPLTPGATAMIDWNPGNGPFKVRAAYLATDAANPSSRNQSFIGPATPLAILLYPGGGGNRGFFGATHQGVVELEYSPSRAFAARLQYSSGNVFDRRFEVFGFNFELAVSEHLAIFGRYAYGSYNNTAFGDINPNYWMAGIVFPDLFMSHALAGIAAGQPFIENGLGNATQTNIEAFYNFPISNNIRLTPLVQVITNPANQSSNGTIVTGTLRTVFSF
jgi:porin